MCLRLGLRDILRHFVKKIKLIQEKVFLKVLPIKGVMKFEKMGNLSPNYIGIFEIL